MPKQIKILPWSDPFDELLLSFEADSDNDRYGLVNLEVDNEYEEAPRVRKGRTLGPAIVSEIGVMPLNDITLVSKNFSMFMMHTNFSISAKVANIVEECDGIESLDIISRYRLRFSIAQMFSIDIVKKTLETLLCSEPKPKDNNSFVQSNLINFLKSRYAYWAIVTTIASSTGLAKGCLVPVHGNSPTEVDERVNKEKNVKEVIRSWTQVTPQ